MSGAWLLKSPVPLSGGSYLKRYENITDIVCVAAFTDDPLDALLFETEEAMKAFWEANDLPNMEAYQIEQGYTWTDPVTGQEIMWDVCRIAIAVQRGEFEKATLPMTLLPNSPNYENLERSIIDRAKNDPERLRRPLVAVMLDRGDGINHVATFVDGNHRLTARWELGLPTFDVFVIPPEREGHFRMTHQ